MDCLTSSSGWQQVRRAIGIIVCLLAGSIDGSAQYSPAFDSAYRSALSIPDPELRIEKMRSIYKNAEGASVFQTISYSKAFLQLATELGSDTDRYSANLLLSSGYERNRDFEQATAHCMEAINIAGKLRDYMKQVRAFESMAFNYSSLGLMSGDKADMDKAFYYSDQAMAVSRKYGIKEEVPYILTMMADVHAMNKIYDTAINLYYQAIAAHREQGSKATMSLYANLGIALNLHKDYDAAMAAYAMADSVADKQDAGNFFKMKIASNRAILLGDMGRTAKSEQLARQVLDSARRSGATDVQIDMIDHLEQLLRRQGRYQEALALSDSMAAIKERMLSAEKTGQVAEMQARYDAGVKDQEIAGQQQTIKQNKRQNMLLWAGIALLFTVGSAAYVGLRRSRQLNRKITAQQQQLLIQKTELQHINEMKDRLFSLIGHDVRAPLNALMAYAALLDQQDGQLPPEKVKQYNADLRQTLGNTTILMENLLQFAKTQMQAARPYPEMILLSHVIGNAASLLKPAMELKGITLVTDYDPDTGAFADEDMTEVILRNLISNAIKFSGAGGKIMISVRPLDEGRICCTVRDNGMGMRPELVALWNNEAVPVPVRSSAGTAQEKGAGLGLMLCKSFAGLMHGRLQVESGPDGSAFSLVLPRKAPEA